MGFMRSPRLRRISGGIVAAVAIVATAAGCSSSGSSGSGSGSSGAAGGGGTIQIGVAAPAAEFTIPYIAQQDGLFKKAGLNVQVTAVPASSLLAAMAGGKLQFGIFSAPQPELGVLAGAKLKWLAVWLAKENIALVGKPGMKSLSDLAGGTYGNTAAGSTSEVLTNAVLKKHGVSGARAVNLGSVPNVASAFAAGSVDAAPLSSPLWSDALKKRPGSTILSEYSEEFPWVGAGIVGNSDWTSTHQAQTVALLKAMFGAIDYYKTQPVETKKIVSKVTGITDADDLNVAYAQAKSLMTDDYTPNDAVEQSVLSILSDSKPAAKKATPEEFIDPSFAKQAQS